MNDGRGITAKLPDELVVGLDAAADRINRSKSWIVRSALRDWLEDEQKRFALNSEEPGLIDGPP